MNAMEHEVEKARMFLENKKIAEKLCRENPQDSQEYQDGYFFLIGARFLPEKYKP